MKELNAESFTDLLASDDNVLVDFWAPWCGPCRMVGPILEKLAPSYEGKLTFAKVNVDENQPLAQRFDVRGIPCMIIFKKGSESVRIIGALPEASLKKKIDEALQ